MKKIGMLVAIRKEMDAVLSRYGAARETAFRCGSAMARTSSCAPKTAR